MFSLTASNTMSASATAKERRPSAITSPCNIIFNKPMEYSAFRNMMYIAHVLQNNYVYLLTYLVHVIQSYLNPYNNNVSLISSRNIPIVYTYIYTLLRVTNKLQHASLFHMGCRLCQNPKTVDVMKWSRRYEMESTL